MLKALELSGFKSFADKTRFEFPPGITVVVGPNGSGKSNIVDAIKWVLGEQSAKSLRGKDMSDVIFKGSSGANSRRPANAATATIILDNSDKRFAFDAEEVHVTRRVYRSGESEYLINGESTRLKDIRELFRGTGVGTDAYSLIEQGKVERMLSTNAKDRRAIFEEAAGISRFKAKKVDAQRRLARVDANLIRLADIVDEVGSRYRSVKSQASKAARYKEHSDRLQQLRTYVGLKDWRSFSEKLEKIQTENAASVEAAERLTAEISNQDSTTKEVESRLDEISMGLVKHQETAGQVRERLAQIESHLSLNKTRLEDLDHRKSQMAEQFERSKKRTEEFKARIESAEKEAETAELNYRDASDRLQEHESELEKLDERILSLQSGSETSRSKYTELVNFITQIGRAVSAADSQVETLTESKSRFTGTSEELISALESHQKSHQQFVNQRENLQKEAESKDSALAEARKQYEQYKSELAGRRERLTDLTNQQSGLSQRAEVIEELEKSLEGINAGAKELLQHAHAGKQGPMADVVGLVADLVSVNVQHAAIVDVALGELAQFVIVDGDNLINQIADNKIKLNGRVGLIQLDSPPTLGADPDVNLNGAPGVIGRADRLIQVKPEYVKFIRTLLGGTWVVKTLGEALHLHANHPHADQVRFVTLDGEIVESDGAVVVGPKSSTSGLVSRRSELRALKRELIQLDEAITQCRAQVSDLTQKEAAADASIQLQLNENTELASRLSDQTMQAKAAEKQIQQTEKQLTLVQSDLADSSTRLGELERKLGVDRGKLAAQELALGSLTQLIASSETQAADSQKQRGAIEKASTAAKVRLAKAEQVLESVQTRAAQYRTEFDEQNEANNQLKVQREGDEKAAEAAKAEIETALEELSKLTR